MDRSHRTRPPDVEEALSSMLWRPYDKVEDSPPYQRRLIAESKLTKFRRLRSESSLRFRYPFISSIRTPAPPNFSAPYFVCSSSGSSNTLKQSFTDDFLSSRCPAVKGSDSDPRVPNEVNIKMDSSSQHNGSAKKSESNESVCKVIKSTENNNVEEGNCSHKGSEDQNAIKASGGVVLNCSNDHDGSSGAYIRNIVISDCAVTTSSGILAVPDSSQTEGTSTKDMLPENLRTNSQRNKVFKSTEVQTDTDFQPQEQGPIAPIISREERRRDRRERRHNRAQNQRGGGGGGRHYHPNTHASRPEPTIEIALSNLPDNQFQPPPYSTLPLDRSRSLPLQQSPSSGNHNYGYQHPCNSSVSTQLQSTSSPPPPVIPQALSTSITTSATADDPRFLFPLPVLRRSPSERSGKGCCGKWFTGPPVRALIAMVALGGVACAISGAALGSTGLVGPTSSHLTAALLMIGVGLILVTVSGAAWRITSPGSSQQCFGLGSSSDDILNIAGRRPCSRGGNTPQGLLYPEYQHRPPPPTYQASMQEYRLRLLLLDRDRKNVANRNTIAVPSPPPTYRSYNGSLLRVPLALATNLVQVHYPGRLIAYRSNRNAPGYRNTVPENGAANIPTVTTAVQHEMLSMAAQKTIAQPEHSIEVEAAGTGADSDQRMLLGGGCTKESGPGVRTGTKQRKICIRNAESLSSNSKETSCVIVTHDAPQSDNIDVLAHV